MADAATGGAHVVVIGAGIGGLAASLALSRLGYRVTVVERDDTPMPDDVEGAFAWDRRGAPQVRHTHGFPALIRVILRDRYPDVLQALLDAGVTEVSIMPPSVPADAPNYERDAEDLQVLSCRRTTLEWVLRRCALEAEGVRFHVGVGVDGLLADRSTDNSSPLEVRGVRLEDGVELPADLVVASAGRRCAVPAWFAAHDVVVPEEEHPTGTIYLSRFYRSVAGDDAPIGYQGGRRAGLGFVVAGADHGTYSATLAVPADDAELRAHLLDPDRYEAVLPLFREMEPVVRRGGSPITPVQVMGGLINRIRRYLDDDGAPIALGFFADRRLAHLHQPGLRPGLLARGAAGGPGGRRPGRASRRSRRCVAPLRGGQRGAGRALVRRVGPHRRGVSPPPRGGAPPRPTCRPPGGAATRPGTLRRIAASGDPELAVIVARTMSLLITPQEVFGDPAVLARLAAVASVERPRDPNRRPHPPLTRDDLLAAGR